MYIIKLLFFSILTVCLAFLCLPALIVFYPWRKKIGPWMVQFYSIISLVILRVRVERRDKINIRDAGDKGIILISNHISYLDIFVLSALYRTIYVSKVEVMFYPLIGLDAWLTGIIFLRRSSQEERHKLILKIADEAMGRVITIFPQGTTSSSKDPLPFKCGIFKTPEINNGIVLIPLTIHYKEGDEIAWTTEQLLFDNIKKVCSQKRIHVKVAVHEPVSIEDYGGRTISEICAMVQDTVLSGLKKDY